MMNDSYSEFQRILSEMKRKVELEKVKNVDKTNFESLNNIFGGIFG